MTPVTMPFPRFSMFSFNARIVLGQFVTPELLARVDSSLILVRDIWLTCRRDFYILMSVTGFGIVVLYIYGKVFASFKICN